MGRIFDMVFQLYRILSFCSQGIFTLDEYLWDYARYHINDLPYRFRLIFSERLEDEADIFAWLYYFLADELIYRQKRFPLPDQQAYERIILREEKTAHRIKMSWEQFRAERLNKYIIEILEKRANKFIAANNVYIFDESADIDKEITKIMTRKNRR